MQSVESAKELAYKHKWLLQERFMGRKLTETADEVWNNLPQTEKDWFLEMRDGASEVAKKVYGQEMEAHKKEQERKRNEAIQETLFEMEMQKVNER